MKFTALDRIAMLYGGILPSEGNRMLMGLVDTAQRQLVFTQAELDEIEYKPLADGRFSYDLKKADALVIDVAMPRHLRDAVWTKFEELDKGNRLTMSQIALYDKFQALMNDEGFQ